MPVGIARADPWGWKGSRIGNAWAVLSCDYASLVLLSFEIDSAACFGPKFHHSVVDCSAAGGIVRDDEAIALISAD